MTAIEIIKRRTDCSDSEAQFYIDLAELRIRDYLNIASTESIDKYVLAIADIATLYLQLDGATKQTKSSLGYSSESFSEGGVSVSHSIANGATTSQAYENQILDILKGLDNNNSSNVVMFL